MRFQAARTRVPRDINHRCRQTQKSSKNLLERGVHDLGPNPLPVECSLVVPMTIQMLDHHAGQVLRMLHTEERRPRRGTACNSGALARD